MPPNSHEEFQELCALSTTGELTEEEWTRLEAHLAHCAGCSEAQREYERVIATSVPALGVETVAEQDEKSTSGSWSIDEAEDRLMRSLPKGPQPSHTLIPRSRFSGWNHAPHYAMAAVLLVACSMAGYWIGARRERGSNAVAPRASTPSNPVNPPVRPAVPAVDDKAASQRDQTLKLRNQLRQS
jgi:hypothetical protein